MSASEPLRFDAEAVAGAGSHDDDEVRTTHQRNFDALNEAVASTGFDRHLRFLNFGYHPLEGEPVAGPDLPRLYPNPESAHLVFELVGDVPIEGRDLLDVGCGRGGALALLDRHYRPRRTFGLDLVASSVRFSATARLHADAGFVQGDAEALPFADRSVDVVVNVESSCCYPDVEAFYREVSRVLRPGGHLLYSDLVSRAATPAVESALAALGLRLVAHRDVTANVVAARERVAARQQQVFDDPEAAGFGHWLGTEGSVLHELLTRGEHAYQVWRWERTEVPTVALPPPEQRLLPDEVRAELHQTAWISASVLEREVPEA